MARTPNSAQDTLETTVEAEPVGPLGKMKWVVLNRPQGNTDSHQFIGFNDYEKQIQFDVPVQLPEVVIKHLQSIRHVDFRAGADGNPSGSYYKAYSLVEVDAPDTAEA